jgi:hypothetical protein
LAYQDEESIKAELRELTNKTRKLREELDGLVRSGGAKDLTRGLLHVSDKVRLDPPAVSDERRRKPRTKKR